MNKMYKYLCIATAVAGLLGACAPKQEDTHEENGEVCRIHVSDGMLRDEADDIVVLRGMSTHGLGWYPRYINSSSLNTLKAEGANIIRLAMYSDADSGYLTEPYNLDFVYIGIENAIANDMYVIVDWHILEDNNPLIHQEEAIAFFDEISEYYKDTPNILYEICNEPNGATTWEDIYNYAMQVIPVIRENAPEAVILVGSPSYSTAVYEAMERPLPFDNLMYSYHKYVDVSSEAEPEFYWLEKAVEESFPVFVTEWGIAYKDESYISGERTPYDDGMELCMNPAYDFLDFLEEHQISWCGWALSNSDEIHAAIRKDCDKLSGWTDEDLTQGGKLMFSYFKDREDRT